jgi:hypothetical protein
VRELHLDAGLGLEQQLRVDALPALVRVHNGSCGCGVQLVPCRLAMCPGKYHGFSSAMRSMILRVVTRQVNSEKRPATSLFKTVQPPRGASG